MRQPRASKCRVYGEAALRGIRYYTGSMVRFIAAFYLQRLSVFLQSKSARDGALGGTGEVQPLRVTRVVVLITPTGHGAGFCGRIARAPTHYSPAELTQG